MSGLWSSLESVAELVHLSRTVACLSLSVPICERRVLIGRLFRPLPAQDPPKARVRTLTVGQAFTSGPLSPSGCSWDPLFATKNPRPGQYTRQHSKVGKLHVRELLDLTPHSGSTALVSWGHPKAVGVARDKPRVPSVLPLNTRGGPS